ncbi:hypothetical protein BaRGS_00039364 [Batillaria attramentaria]|uniref:Fucosyltransferase n=1 Tax=Batillaria attramentaria TaxID=370345 RepID=A0ABD0J3D0_9CAEN
MPDNNSVILVDDFDSPKELADFIKYLDENDEDWPHIDWTSLYWNDLDRARAALRMVQEGERDTTKFEKYHREEMAKLRRRN